MHTSAEFEIVKTIKEKFCQVATQPLSKDYFVADIENKSSQEYILPDGNVLNIGNNIKFAPPEILFNPAKIGLEYPGLPELMHKAIMNCDIDLRKTLFQTIYLAGGCTSLNNFAKRFHASLKHPTFLNNIKVKVSAPSNRQQSCWIGGSTLSSLKAFNSMWITKNEYHSAGKAILFN